MREAIMQYVERVGARESFMQEALASWAAHQEIGQHLTSQEARIWLIGWGTDAEAEPPKCYITECNEPTIELGGSGDIALYRYEYADGTAYVLAFRQPKEATGLQ